MKKIYLSILIIATLLLNSFSIAFASDGSVDVSEQKELNTMSQKFDISTNELLTISKELQTPIANLEVKEIKLNSSNRESLYLQYDLKDENENQLLPQGFKVCEEKIIEISSKDRSYTLSAANKHRDTNIVFHKILGNTDPVNLANSSKGMSYWLDVSFNLLIGSKTKYAWKACTILGIAPSNYLPHFTRGDALNQSYQMTLTEKYIQVYYNNQGWFSCAKASHKEVINHLDMYTFDKNGKAQEKHKSETKTYWSKYYNNDSYLTTKALSEFDMSNGMSMYVDNIV